MHMRATQGEASVDAAARVDALGPRGEYQARHRVVVNDVRGETAVDLGLIPRLFVWRGVSALRKATPLPVEERTRALVEAGRIFANDTLGGLSPDAYQRLVSRVSGMPLYMVRRSTAIIAESAAKAYQTAHCARPQAAAASWTDARTFGGSAVWTRRNDVFGVLASGNTPSVHSLWLEALALGYRVAVRPSQHEPLTPYRLVLALHAAGFRNEDVMLFPTDHAVADTIVDSVDLAIVYGGDAVVEKHRDSRKVQAQGPGRSKILVTRDDWRDRMDMIVESIAGKGATNCINATAVFVDGDADAFAEALAERLAAMPSLPPDHDDALLPVQSLEHARGLESFLLGRAAGTRAVLGGDGIVHDLGDGSAVLRPAVFRVDDANAPQTGTELPFPCVWVAPWSKSDGVAPLRDTLVLTAVTDDRDFVETLLEEPTITNVYLGDTPTTFLEPGIPHDSYLGEFLMRTKAVAR